MRKTVSYQQGCLYREKRKAGPAVWVFRYRDGQSNRKVIVGTVDDLKTKTEAKKACESLRSTINRDTDAPLNVAELVDHYTEKELSDDGTKGVFHAGDVRQLHSLLDLCPSGANTRSVMLGQSR